MLITGIIPSRFDSTRFPGKPLAMIGDKSMIRMVWEEASKVLESVFVATDDQRIADEVTGFGGFAIMTSPHHRTGTERCAEAAGIIESQFGISPDTIINIQGDEPFFSREQAEKLVACFDDNSVEIATLVKKIDKYDDLVNPGIPKVLIAANGDAICFSRATIPYNRDLPLNEWLRVTDYYKHIGMYGYRTSVLKKISSLDSTPAEISESLEQLRWLGHGYRIRTAITNTESIGIDTPEDLENAKILLNK
ncbi:MAG: 3-deoxy-manno-octulosonate cytidylyltransferase [Bacteroidales bacterium]|nr:3-deoxy-manno-octulosonate cytidylyltransferase [Bacteroidales bacterium]